MSDKTLNAMGNSEYSRHRELTLAVDQFVLCARLLDCGILAEANDKLLRVLGFAYEEIVKVPFAALLTREHTALFHEQVQPLLRRGLGWNGELCLRARNGNLRWLECSITPPGDQGNNRTHCLFLAFDITDRKSIESALVENTTFFHRLMEMTPVGILLADSEGCCTYINKVWSEASGLRLHQALGMGWLQGVHPADQNQLRQTWCNLVSKGEPFHCEFRYLQSTQRVVWVEAFAERVEFIPDGKARFIRIEVDLSERRESERIINEHKARMAAAAKMSALGEMAGGIAHEINNPLAILQLRARQVVKLAQNPSPDLAQLIAAAQSIHITTDRIAAIVRAMRAIARNGHSDPFMLAPLRNLITEALELSAERFRSVGITLTVRAFPEHLELRCRPVEILQLLLNLLNNAFAAVEKLQSPWVEVSIHESEGRIEIWVTGSGKAIYP